MKPISFFLSVLLLSLSSAAIAKTENPDAGKPFATIWRVKGEVFAADLSGVRRRIMEGSEVAVGEEISATATGEALLKTRDGGLIAVRPNARFVAERYAAEGSASDRQSLRLMSGALRIVSGWIGKLNRSEHQVHTPTATIGIRGTDHEPYVLPRELANETYRSGTYDKVTRGGTILEANGGAVDIAPGKVGFVRDPVAARTRALMTLLMPVLLDKVPGFYVAGSFDDEVERYSREAEKESLRALGARNPAALAGLAENAVDTRGDGRSLVKKTTPSSATVAEVMPQGCAPREIAVYWLGRFDAAVQRQDARTVLAMLAPEITAAAHVRSGDERLTIDFDRDELVKSTLAAMSSVKDYQSRRVSLAAELAEGESEANCRRLRIRSVAIEQGVMDGKPYRVEAQEDYLLERRENDWLAIRAETTQH